MRRLVSESPSISHALPRGVDLRVHFILIFGRIFQRKPQYLNIVNLPAVKPKNQFWVYHLLALAEVCHTEVILFVLNIVDFARVGNHAVELVVTLVQALLLASFTRLLGVVNASAVRVLLAFILLRILTCFTVLILIVHLFKVEILDDLLHFLDYIRLAYQIFAILLGRVSLIGANLHHALRVGFVRVQGHIFLININAGILEYYGELFAGILLSYGLSLAILLNDLRHRTGKSGWLDPANNFWSFALVERHLRVRIEALDVAFLDEDGVENVDWALFGSDQAL